MENFDKQLRASKGGLQYHLDKVRGGQSGSSAGKPRPYARANIAIAQLYSPRAVGRVFAVKPKSNWNQFRMGAYYEWKMTEPGYGLIDGVEVSADELKKNFIIITKRRK